MEAWIVELVGHREELYELRDFGVCDESVGVFGIDHGVEALFLDAVKAMNGSGEGGQSGGDFGACCQVQQGAQEQSSKGDGVAEDWAFAQTQAMGVWSMKKHDVCLWMTSSVSACWLVARSFVSVEYR